MPTPQPHRRDRRRPANGTRGGQVNSINTLLVTDADDDQIITLQMVFYTPTDPTDYYTNEGAKADPALSLSGWKYFDLGVEVQIDTVALNAAGELTVSLDLARSGEGILVFPPFLPALRGLSGSVNSGGPIYVGAPTP